MEEASTAGGELAGAEHRAWDSVASKMNFNTSTFALFFLVVSALYFLLQTGRKWKSQNVILLVASYIFYGAWDQRFLFLIGASTALDYVCGLGIAGRSPRLSRVVVLCAIVTAFGISATHPHLLLEGSWEKSTIESSVLIVVSIVVAIFSALLIIGQKLEGNSRRVFFLVLSLVGNLGILFAFKYCDFFLDSLRHWTHADFDYTIGVVVPVGISFYTFQTLSYSIDIYRRELEPTESIVDFSLFVAYFPQLVAGPIERARVLLPQIARARNIDLFALQTGCYLVGWGLFKKIFVADNLAPLVEKVYSSPAPTGPDIWLGTLAFAFQIYCDFSAYSDIARGVSRLFGIELMVNFNVPYAATNPQEFWRRWHISLSTWLRDYLYISLGGSRFGSLITYRNLLVTMILGGLWHGAGFNFLLWGVFQGVLLCAHRLSTPLLERISFRSAHLAQLWKFCCWAVFLNLVLFGWLLFRSESWEQIVALSYGLTTGWTYWKDSIPLAARIVWFTSFLLVVDLACLRKSNLLAVMNWPAPLRVAAYCTMFYLVTIFGAFDKVDFIYFQF